MRPNRNIANYSSQINNDTAYQKMRPNRNAKDLQAVMMLDTAYQKKGAERNADRVKQQVKLINIQED